MITTFTSSPQTTQFVVMNCSANSTCKEKYGNGNLDGDVKFVSAENEGMGSHQTKIKVSNGIIKQCLKGPWLGNRASEEWVHKASVDVMNAEYNGRNGEDMTIWIIKLRKEEDYWRSYMGDDECNAIWNFNFQQSMTLTIRFSIGDGLEEDENHDNDGSNKAVL